MKKVLVCKVGQAPFVELAANPWDYTKEYLIGENSLIQVVHLDDGVAMYFDEEGTGKKLPVNRLVPARAPNFNASDFSFVIDTTGGNRPAPGEMGVHIVRGHFLLCQEAGVDGEGEMLYKDLTDTQIKKYEELLGGPPPCPQCGKPRAYANAIYCGAACSARAGF